MVEWAPGTGTSRACNSTRPYTIPIMRCKLRSLPSVEGRSARHITAEYGNSCYLARLGSTKVRGYLNRMEQLPGILAAVSEMITELTRITEQNALTSVIHQKERIELEGNVEMQAVRITCLKKRHQQRTATARRSFVDGGKTPKTACRGCKGGRTGGCLSRMQSG